MYADFSAMMHLNIIGYAMQCDDDIFVCALHPRSDCLIILAYRNRIYSHATYKLHQVQ